MPTVKVHFKKSPSEDLQNIHVSETEMLLLELLGTDSLTAPSVSRKTNGRTSVQSAYVLLRRLVKKGLLTAKSCKFKVIDIEVNRVVYESTFDSIEVLS